MRNSLLALVWLSLGVPSLAWAQSPASPSSTAAQTDAKPSLSDSLTGEAKADYESAKLLFGDGDSAGALVKFSSAYEKSKDVRLLWNMAACEKNLRRYSRSLKLVRRYLAEGDATLSEQDKSEAQELIKVMEPFTAKLALKVDEPDAEVFVDEEAMGVTPLDPIVVDIGSRRILVRKDGFEEFKREVPIGGAAEIVLDVSLAKIVREGRLNVRTNEDATISIDGRVVGKGTWSGIVSSGGHELRIRAPKKRPYQSEVYVQDKESRDVNVTLEDEAGKGVPMWVWIAGGAVLLGGATTAGVLLLGGDRPYEGPVGNLQPGLVQANAPIRF